MSAPRRKLRMYLISALVPAALVLFISAWVGPIPWVALIIGSVLLGWMVAMAHS